MKAADFDEFPRALRDDEPQVADEWKLIHVIGKGGMGKVYGGVLKDKTYAAIKMISSENLTPSQLSRFNKEIDAMKLVNSTHIAKLLGASTSNDPPYIAIEYIYGKTFKDLIENKVEITEKDWYVLARQVFYALREIHLRGLTHRDISPSNIMKLNDVKQIKIIDFGLVKQMIQLIQLDSILSEQFPTCHLNNYRKKHQLLKAIYSVLPQLWFIFLLKDILLKN
jgi:serine/threonine protein kinase